MNETTLSFTVTGDSLRSMLMEARKVAAEFFGDVPFQLASFPVHTEHEMRAAGSGVVHRTFTADAVYVVVNRKVRTPDDPIVGDEDDDNEVRIP